MYPLIVFGALALILIGFYMGSSLGRRLRGRPATSQNSAQAPRIDPRIVTPMQDLILSPDEVVDKSIRTTRLLSTLATNEPLFDPEPLHKWIRDLFYQVQYCRQARDPGPVKQSMTPIALDKYDELIRAMRRNREINRVDDLQVRRLEFVHVLRPAEVEHQTVTALITFEGKAHFVHETSGAYIRGAQKNTWYQEFWTFQRHGEGWKLHEVQESWNDTHLREPNRVHGMSDVELEKAEGGVILL
jgi:predicted lipid-binding transport protein (Tim44 family)